MSSSTNVHVESPHKKYCPTPTSTPHIQVKNDQNNKNVAIGTNGHVISRQKAFWTIAILFIINLLNYIDRFTIAAVLRDIQQYYGINDAWAGLLQTVFICAYMIFAPVFGYLGDRYSRKTIMIFGIFVWVTAVLFSTFAQPHQFWLFMLLRGIVGIGEASYSTVSPTIIADMFTKDKRSIMLMVFYFAIPVGSGLGFVTGDAVSRMAGAWQWGIRVTPIFGAIFLLFFVIIFTEPVRGGTENGELITEPRPFKTDLIYLANNKSFVWSTMGFVCVSFVSGAIAFWTPNFIKYSQELVNKSAEGVPIKFGAVTCLAGFFGVTVGSMWATRWRKTNGKADPFVCAIGLIFCFPFYIAALNCSDQNLILVFPLVFAAITGLCLNWAVLSDMLMYVVVPVCRSSANAVQLLIGHLLGDAFSPYIIGLVSDFIRNESTLKLDHYKGLKYALYIPLAVMILGVFFFILTACFIINDKKRADECLKSCSRSAVLNSSMPTTLTITAELSDIDSPISMISDQMKFTIS